MLSHEHCEAVVYYGIDSETGPWPKGRLSGGAKEMLTRQLTLCLRTHGFSLRAGIAYACLR